MSQGDITDLDISVLLCEIVSRFQRKVYVSKRAIGISVYHITFVVSYYRNIFPDMEIGFEGYLAIVYHDCIASGISIYHYCYF